MLSESEATAVEIRSAIGEQGHAAAAPQSLAQLLPSAAVLPSSRSVDAGEARIGSPADQTQKHARNPNPLHTRPNYEQTSDKMWPELLIYKGKLTVFGHIFILSFALYVGVWGSKAIPHKQIGAN